MNNETLQHSSIIKQYSEMGNFIKEFSKYYWEDVSKMLANNVIEKEEAQKDLDKHINKISKSFQENDDIVLCDESSVFKGGSGWLFVAIYRNSEMIVKSIICERKR